MHRHWKAFLAVVFALAFATSVWAASTYSKGVASGQALFNFAASAGTPVFASDFRVQSEDAHPVTFVEIGVCVETSTTVALRVTDGTTSKDILLNSTIALPSNGGATFVWPLDAKDQDGEDLSYNVVFADATLVRLLSVREIQGR